MATFSALLVGAGGMGRPWGKNLRGCDEVRLAGWIDLRPDAAAQAADELGVAGVVTGSDLERALAELRPDFVVDVTIPEAHHDVTLAALAAGVPVLGEKPMADSMERARAMVAASERAGKLYMVSQSRRYDARLHALRRLVVEQIGQLGILNSDFYIGAHFGGVRDQMPSPLLLDMAIHTLDAARYISAADPLAVYCEEFNPPWSWYAGPAHILGGRVARGRAERQRHLGWACRASGRGGRRHGRLSFTGLSHIPARSRKICPPASPDSYATFCTRLKPARRQWANATIISRAWRWSSPRSSRPRQADVSS